MKVLVLDGNENQAVACVRSLCHAGHRVRVGASTTWSKAGWSRDCSGTFRYPAPEQDIQAFVKSIVTEVKRSHGALVLPMTEGTTLPLSANRDLIFEANGRIELPPHDTVLRAFDKQQTTRLAQSLGIAVPETTLVVDDFHACELAHSIRYPVVLKPRSSEEISPTGGIRPTGRSLYACNAQQFMVAYSHLRSRGSHVLTQEFIEGIGSGYFALMRHGQLLAEFGHRRIRDVHPTGSGSSVRVSVKPDPQLRDAGLAILQALTWHGVAMVEFRVRRDGTPVFMEVNGRFWASLALAVYAGVNFPALLARMAGEGDVSESSDYRLGVRCRWLLGDFRHLIEVWRGAPVGYPGRFPGCLRTLASMLIPVPGTFHDNFSWRDPLPELGDWLDFGLRRLPGQIAAGLATRKEKSAQRGYAHT
jgi:predicted ATP-grasp superfamily ATP-dependent carboligase